MKLLVQDSGKSLVWKDAVYQRGQFYLDNGTKTCDTNSIYSIKDDNRDNIVICSACGAEIPNNKWAIKAHRNMVNQSNKCFECRHLEHSNAKTISHKYVLNEDGSYAESTKRNVKLLCKMGWKHYDINSDDAKTQCKYAACENAEFRHVNDFWTKYPNAFDEFITVDRIIDYGYKQMYKRYDHIEFELKGRGSIIACVNYQGVCYGFAIRHRNNVYSIRYSKKYDKALCCEYGNFKELQALPLAESTRDAILNKLRTLYK